MLPAWPGATSRPAADWLIDDSGFKAGVFRGAATNELVLANGLLARTFRLEPNAATVGLDHQVTGQAILRGVKPEAVIELGGRRYEIGGLQGQPNYAFLRPEWVDQLRARPAAFRFVGFEVGPPLERFAWKRVRHHAPGVAWPPRGVHLRMDYTMPPASAVVDEEVPPPSAERRRRLLADDFRQLDPAWRIHASSADDRSSFAHEGRAGAMYVRANSALFAERPLPPETRLVEVAFEVGTDRCASWGPGLALVGRERALKFYVRPGGSQGDTSPQFGVWVGNGEALIPGGPLALDIARPVSLRLRWGGEAVLCEFQPLGGAWRTVHRVPLSALPAGPLAVRIGKTSRSGGADDFAEPGDAVRLRWLSFAAYSEAEAPVVAADDRSRAVQVSVHYELYDGLPCYSKWLTVSNGTANPIRVDRFASEVLAVIEHTSEVDELTAGRMTPGIHVETDMSFGGMMAAGANRRSYRWLSDPDFHTQVNYEKKTPCLLEIGPDLGPAQEVAPGGSFSSFRAWVLPFDSTDRERCGLSVRRMYRTVAPWATENPLMMHVRSADERTVIEAIDQCAAVGFEMVILSFGSGFDLENESAATLATAQRYAAYARGKGIEIGSYSLLASRHVGGGHDVVMPLGQSPAFGNSPCLASAWGTNYFRRLYEFHRDSGYTLLEHDGSYPGDVCQSDRHPAHRGLADSRWNQWRRLVDFYQWCRAQGIYLNVPDHYFLSGSSKTGMGYREVNWSLPREQQVIHTRQNIYDGTWEKRPSMGWMFVPLTEYHGGGPAATIEPLDTHLDHYERMLVSNLALGVQACYRGPRLYDTPRTQAMVQRWVAWFKAHRDLLESDLIHGRRADARDLDWMLHVNPQLEKKGLLVVFNPLSEPLARTLKVTLYYTGLTDRARVSEQGQAAQTHTLNREYSIDLPVRVPAQGMTWYLID